MCGVLAPTPSPRATARRAGAPAPPQRPHSRRRGRARNDGGLFHAHDVESGSMARQPDADGTVNFQASALPTKWAFPSPDRAGFLGKSITGSDTYDSNHAFFPGRGNDDQ